MIDRVHPAARPSNQEPRERRRTPLRHQKPPAVAAGDEHAARQSSAEPYDHATASYLAEARQAKIARNRSRGDVAVISTACRFVGSNFWRF
jgi:hypothetical protein